MKIKKIFISHLHADHFLGLPGLIQSMSLNGREEELMIYGPKGTEDAVEAMLNLGYFKSAYRVGSKDLRPGKELEFSGYSVKCVQADHTIPTLAYSLEEKPRPGRFDIEKAKGLGVPEGPMFGRLQDGKAVVVQGVRIAPEMVLGPQRPGRKLVYSGDTKPSKRIIKLAEGADVLIHDCTLDASHRDLASNFGHSTAEEAAKVARAAGVGMLFLVHFSPRYDETSALEKEAAAIFKNTRAAEDLSEHLVRYRD
jgi:ribonuclease Z